MSVIARESSITPSLLMALAVFTVFPLRLVGMMEVTKKIFGQDVTDAMITHGILIVMHQGNLVRLYSFQHVLQMGEVPNSSPSSGSGQSSSSVATSGLTLNIVLKERPPLLYELRCSEHNMRLGGIPWHYIITPPGSRGYFKVYDLENKQLADGGYLDMDTVSIEPDKCLFHPDDSGRILHVGSKQITVLKLTSKDEEPRGLAKSKVEELYTIEPFRDKTNDKTDVPVITASGRAVRRVFSYTQDMVEDSYENIATVDYENELDLLFVGLVNQGQTRLEGKVHLYDNHNGKLIKEIVLQENWKEFCDHIISVDLDTLVHIVKAPMRKFSCYVYRLQRHHTQNTDLKDEISAKKRQIEYSLLEDTHRRSRRNRQRINYEET